jgi:hypothetical protein
MTRELVARDTPVFDQFHPGICGAAVGLVVWFAAAAWILLDRQSDIGLPLAMVSALLLIAVVLPWLLSLVWSRHRMPHERHPNSISLRLDNGRLRGLGEPASRHAGRHRHAAAACGRGIRSYGAGNRLSNLRHRRSLDRCGPSPARYRQAAQGRRR